MCEQKLDFLLFLGDDHFNDDLRKQILWLDIHLTVSQYRLGISKEWFDLILARILAFFPNVKSLGFTPSYLSTQHFPFDISSASFVSSTLLKFFGKIRTYTDRLHILDGRFEQLHTLHVDIYSASPSVFNDSIKQVKDSIANEC